MEQAREDDGQPQERTSCPIPHPPSLYPLHSPTGSPVAQSLSGGSEDVLVLKSHGRVAECDLSLLSSHVSWA